MVGANSIRPLMIQIHFPIYGTVPNRQVTQLHQVSI